MTDPSLVRTASWAVIARLIRPQGRRGEVLAEILTDFPERFTTTRQVCLMRGDTVAQEPALLEQSWLHKGKVVLKFAGVDSIAAAEAICGSDVVVPLSERICLEPDAVYIADLVGCRVFDVHSAEQSYIGRIQHVIQQPETVDLLIVESDDGKEYSIPFAKSYCVHVDLAEQRLEMDLPPGLLEINAPMSEEERKRQQSIHHAED